MQRSKGFCCQAWEPKGQTDGWMDGWVDRQMDVAEKVFKVKTETESVYQVESKLFEALKAQWMDGWTYVAEKVFKVKKKK